MSTGDKIALISLAFTVVTTLCALFLAYAALTHTVRPNIQVRMLTPSNQKSGKEVTFVFAFWNQGHWYGSPMAVDFTAFCNFDPAFDLLDIRYGSIQEYRSDEVRIGVGGMKFLKAKGLKLGRREAGEEAHIRTITPSKPGSYLIRISAYSTNGASITSEFQVFCGLRSSFETESIGFP